MIIERKGNLLEHKFKPTAAILHGVNCQGKMASGFAKQLAKKWPEAKTSYENYYKHHADSSAIYKSVYLLGKVSHNWIEKDSVYVLHCFTQNKYGRDGKKYVSYDAIDECMQTVASTCAELPEIHMPAIGSGLGGGHWPVINEIIEHRLKDLKEVNIWFLE